MATKKKNAKKKVTKKKSKNRKITKKTTRTRKAKGAAADSGTGLKEVALNSIVEVAKGSKRLPPLADCQKWSCHRETFPTSLMTKRLAILNLGITTKLAN